MNGLALIRHCNRWSRYVLAIGFLLQALSGVGYTDSPVYRLRRPWQTELVVTLQAAHKAITPTFTQGVSSARRRPDKQYQTAGILHHCGVRTALEYAGRIQQRGALFRRRPALKKIPVPSKEIELPNS